MVNNTGAMLTGATADSAALQFNVRRDGNGKAVSMVTPLQAGQWYWPGDGLVWKGQVRVFASRMGPGDGGDFNFKQVATDLLTAPATDAAPFLGSYNRRNLPLFAPRNGTLGEIAYGVATMPLTEQAGAPNPDGFLYVYGVRSDDYNKKLLVARVRPDQITNAGAYRFWNGRIDAISGTIAVRYGNSPVGPFGKPIPIWLCPEEKLTANTFVYGAKAHPHLSAPGELLISYHVNTFDFWENFKAGGIDIYRPRFIKLPLP
jgi:hypothetical protein